MIFRTLPSLLALGLALVSCRPTAPPIQTLSSGGNGGTAPAPGAPTEPAPPQSAGGSLPALTAADLPGISPCPNQEILSDPAKFNAFKQALVFGSFLYLDVPFDGSDPDIYRRKCGLGPWWNPADNVDEIAPFNPPITLEGLYIFGNAGICAAGFDNFSFGTGEGFPVEGIYRKEVKISYQGTTYLVRLRVSVWGPAAGSRFIDLGYHIGDIANTFGYEVNGQPQPHAAVPLAIGLELEAPAATSLLDVFDAPGGNPLLTAVTEVLCVEIL